MAALAARVHFRHGPALGQAVVLDPGATHHTLFGIPIPFWFDPSAPSPTDGTTSAGDLAASIPWGSLALIGVAVWVGFKIMDEL